MQYKPVFPLLAAFLLLTGCGVNITNENFTPTPDFVTATLPLSSTQPATTTPMPATSLPTLPPIEGTTTTQVNVRSEPSTIGSTLGVIPAFSKVQVLGRESNGAWYQIVHASAADGKGWVTAAYVQVDEAAKIPVVETGTGSGSSVSGLVVQGIHVRSGPATSYESLGTLIPNDVVTVIGKDSSGAWMQIEFKDQTGWVASEFLQVNGADLLPVTAQTSPVMTTAGPTEVVLVIPTILPSVEDGDSQEAPSASAILSPSNVAAFQFTGNISSPIGDAEDWLQFTSSSPNIHVEVKCSINGLRVELWSSGRPVEGSTFLCKESKLLAVQNDTYLLRIAALAFDLLQVTHYQIKIRAVN